MVQLDYDEELWTLHEMYGLVDDAKSESSWTALAKGKGRGWWSIDLEGDMEMLEVIGPWSGTEGGSVD